MLEDAVKVKDAKIEDLTDKLNAAYKEMREMATSAINASRPTIVTSNDDKSSK
jgi:hypothetical protein